MTVIADNENYLVEYEAKMMSITSRETGLTISFTGARIAGDFRDCLKTHPIDRVVQTYVRMASKFAKWERMYKRLPEIGEAA